MASIGFSAAAKRTDIPDSDRSLQAASLGGLFTFETFELLASVMSAVGRSCCRVPKCRAINFPRMDQTIRDRQSMRHRGGRMRHDPAMRDRSTRSPKLGRASTELSTVGSGKDISMLCGNYYRVLRRARPGRVWIRKSSSCFPALSCAVSQRGCFPRPAQVSDGLAGLLYFGNTCG